MKEFKNYKSPKKIKLREKLWDFRSKRSENKKINKKRTKGNMKKWQIKSNS